MISRTCVVLFLFHGLLLAGGNVWAQPALSSVDPTESPTSDTADAEWETSLIGKFSASQAAYKDWQEGGLNSLSFSFSLDGGAEREGKQWAQAHTMRLALGFLDQEGRQIRKSEDLIRLHSDLQYQGDGFFKQFNPTLAGELRTQFASGFNYTENPYDKLEGDHPRQGEDPPVQTASFFAPATLTESLGLTYDPAESLSFLLGVAAKQTIVLERDFRVLYGVDPDNAVRAEAGGKFSSNLDYDITENIRYRSQLNVFFAVNQLDNPPDAIWENIINLKVNDWLSTDLEYVALYDKDTVNTIQMKEVISIGVNFTLF
ncbi:MAG: DUF3078 domain-containing protein [Salinibacter sp.]